MVHAETLATTEGGAEKGCRCRNPRQRRPPRLSEVKAQRSEPGRSHKGPRCTQICTKSLLEKKQLPGSPSVCSSAGGVKDAQRAGGPGSGPNHATHVSGALGRSVLRRFI